MSFSLHDKQRKDGAKKRKPSGRHFVLGDPATRVLADMDLSDNTASGIYWRIIETLAPEYLENQKKGAFPARAVLEAGEML